MWSMHDGKPGAGSLRALRAVGIAALVAAAALVLAACGGNQPTPTATSAPQAGSPTPSGGGSSEYDDLLKAAQADGELVWVVGGAASRSLRPVADHFQQKFGINIVFSTGSGTQQTARILAEQAAGTYETDLLMIGETSAQQLLAADGIVDLNPLLIEEVVEPSEWFRGRLWFTDPQQKYQINTGATAEPENVAMRYNTDLVSQAEADGWTSIYDFLDPKYAGKIVAIPPTTGGAGGSYYNLMVNPNIDGEDWLSRFFAPALDVTFSDDFRFIADGVAQGAFSFGILIGSAGEDIDRLGADGAPVKRLIRELKEGFTLTGAGSASQISVSKNAPNPNAAKFFLNWWLSKEGQTARHEISEPTVDPTLREDVECFGQPATEDEECRVPGKQYAYLTADPELTAQREQANALAAQMYRDARGL